MDDGKTELLDTTLEASEEDEEISGRDEELFASLDIGLETETLSVSEEDELSEDSGMDSLSVSELDTLSEGFEELSSAHASDNEHMKASTNTIVINERYQCFTYVPPFVRRSVKKLSFPVSFIIQHSSMICIECFFYKINVIFLHTSDKKEF